VAELVDHAIRSTKKNPRFAYIAPTYTQAKDIAWMYLKEQTATIPGVAVKEAELSVTLPGNNAVIRLYGAENYDRLRGIYLDGCIIDEAGDIDERAWDQVIRITLADRGGWAVFIGTPKGENWFYEKFDYALKHPSEWFSLILKASQTGIVPQSEIDDFKRQNTREAYMAEFECSFTAGIKGAYYANDMEALEEKGQIRSVPWDRAADVFASMDLGMNDATAIWVGQVVGAEYRFIDHYQMSGEDLGHYVDWLKSRDYPIHELILPHDAEVRELQTGNSRAQFLRDRGFKVKVLPRTNDRMGDIEVVRTKFNRFWFDKVKCEHGIKCLKNYKSEYDVKNNIQKRTPLHDWTSNSADSFRYFILGAESMSPKWVPVPKSRRIIQGLV
jgi:hypothetical protein